MATAKKTTKKTTKKTDDRFANVKETMDKYTAKLKAYDNAYVNKVLDTGKQINEKYVSKAVETGKELNEKYLKELNEKYFKELNEKYISKAFETSREFAEERYGQVSEAVDKFVVKSRNMKKDAKETFEGFVEVGRNFIETLPGKETVETKVNEGWKTVSGKLSQVSAHVNLPTKEDIAKLSSAMDALNKKVDALNKKIAA